MKELCNGQIEDLVGKCEPKQLASKTQELKESLKYQLSLLSVLNQVLMDETALLAHKKIVKGQTGEAKLVKIPMNAVKKKR
mmetsp:Transcript_23130/g.30818  ORF Transcript_23130/g.30818 Transcript_23130/m.30818 type:complete len:81 (+) Transcript_23130:2114-2356(+)